MRMFRPYFRKRNTPERIVPREDLPKVFGARTTNYRRRVGTTVSSKFGRYPWHDDFLRKHHFEIKIFADVGAANSLGAPATFAAKRALGPNSRVFAIDILSFDHQAAKSVVEKANFPTFMQKLGELKLVKPKLKLETTDVTPVLLAISRHPLTYRNLVPVCDAIRFAMTSGYMAPRDLELAIENISASLRDGGYLLNQHQIFQKMPSGWKVVADGDVLNMG